MACVLRLGRYPAPRVAGPNSYLRGQDYFATIAAVRTYTVLLVDIIAVPDWPHSLDSVGNLTVVSISVMYACACVCMCVCV